MKRWRQNLTWKVIFKDDYRIICFIEDEALTVLVLKIGHRRKVYK
ncbi:type II toxin-antitoxin system RelE family toxin [Crocosphaera sp.]